MKIYFHQKSCHRGVQRDRMNFLPEGFSAITPLEEPGKEPKQINPFVFYKLIPFIINIIPIPNFRFMSPKHSQADLVYTWGDIPINSQKNYIIEVENPYQFTFYNPWALKLFKPLIKKFLVSKKCHAITCWSNACKLSMIKEFGDCISNKTFVLYPTIKNAQINHIKDTKVRFLFIGLVFDLKGARELVKAFHALNEENIGLTIISDYDEDFAAHFKHDKRIKFMHRVDREVLFNEIYPKSDVLVLPTLYDSFGWVSIEALSFGLGVIATDVYALPEVVVPDYNGILLKHPYLPTTKIGNNSFVDITKFHLAKFIKRFVKNKPPSNYLQKQIKKALHQAIKDYKKWQPNSKSHYEDNFSLEKIKSRFKQILESQ